MLGKIGETLGLTPDLSGAIKAAEFNPYNINTSYGSLNYDKDSRTFTSQLDPALQGIQQGLFSQYGQVDPTQQLALMRQQAAPFQQQSMLNMENRLFKQGLTQASVVDQPGGARRSLFDSIMNQDLSMQLQAQQQAQQEQTNYLNQILGISGLEQNMFRSGMGMGQLGMQGQSNVASLMMQQAQAESGLNQALFGGAVLGLSGMDWSSMGGDSWSNYGVPSSVDTTGWD